MPGDADSECGGQGRVLLANVACGPCLWVRLTGHACVHNSRPRATHYSNGRWSLMHMNVYCG